MIRGVELGIWRQGDVASHLSPGWSAKPHNLLVGKIKMTTHYL